MAKTPSYLPQPKGVKTPKSTAPKPAQQAGGLNFEAQDMARRDAVRTTFGGGGWPQDPWLRQLQSFPRGQAPMPTPTPGPTATPRTWPTQTPQVPQTPQGGFLPTQTPVYQGYQDWWRETGEPGLLDALGGMFQGVEQGVGRLTQPIADSQTYQSLLELMYILGILPRPQQ